VITTPSPVPEDRRPFMVASDGVEISIKRMDEDQQYAKHVDEMVCKLCYEYALLVCGRGKKLVIHPTTNHFRRLIATHLARARFHVLTHDVGAEVKEYLHNYRNAEQALMDFIHGSQWRNKPCILISTAITEGIDFAGSEFQDQIIVKVPFPSLNDPWIRTRMKYLDLKSPGLGQLWYIDKTIANICQAYGRICRGPEDLGYTLILDRLFIKYLWNRFRHRFPEWFPNPVTTKVIRS